VTIHGLVGGIMRRFATSRRDPRSRRLVVLIECLLNQNARDLGAAESPATCRALLDLLAEADVGMVQIPCPEIACLGFGRSRPPGRSIRASLEAPEAKACCERLALETAERIQCYLDQGFEVLAVLGGNQESPGCAVHVAGANETRLTERSGVFMLALAAELGRRRLPVPFRGVRDVDASLLGEDLHWLRERIGRLP
jgi:predicted secreted protein